MRPANLEIQRRIYHFFHLPYSLSNAYKRSIRLVVSAVFGSLTFSLRFIISISFFFGLGIDHSSDWDVFVPIIFKALFLFSPQG